MTGLGYMSRAGHMVRPDRADRSDENCKTGDPYDGGKMMVMR